MATPATIQTPYQDPPTGRPDHAGRAVVLSRVLALTFLGSVGTGAVTNGIYFITKNGLGYGRLENLWLGVAFGATYIAAALTAGPMLRRAAAVSDRITTRVALAGILLVMAVVCQLPLLAERVAPSLLGPSIWLMVLVYSPASGALWPIVESYLSGGRREKDLRAAIGRFNIVWSFALVAAYWGMAPLLERFPFRILALLGVLHLLMVAIAWTFPVEPARHDHAEHTHPPVYEALLSLFRVLLFTSYLVVSAVNPIQPIILDRIGVAVAWQLPVASSWLIARVLIFALFERWHGWHGRWWMPWTGLGVLFFGFAFTVGSPAFGGQAVPVFILGLAALGAGLAAIYCGALYYAMAVGTAGVDAGGKHEAVIGTGYTIGPGIALIALAISHASSPPGSEADPEVFRIWTIILTGLAAGGLGLWGWRVARKRIRP